MTGLIEFAVNIYIYNIYIYVSNNVLVFINQLVWYISNLILRYIIRFLLLGAMLIILGRATEMGIERRFHASS